MVISRFCLIPELMERQLVTKVHLKALNLTCLCPVIECRHVTLRAWNRLLLQNVGIPSFPTKTWNEETYFCVTAFTTAPGDVSKWGTNHTHSLSHRIISATSQPKHFFPLQKIQTKHSSLRYHTSTLHCWTWPPSPRRRISNFPDPASPLVQCWHAAGSQLLLEAACESQQRQTHPASPLPPATTAPHHWYFLCAS